MIPRTFLLLLALPVLLLAGLLVACGETEEVPTTTLATSGPATPGVGTQMAQPTATPAQPTVAPTAALPSGWTRYPDAPSGISIPGPAGLTPRVETARYEKGGAVVDDRTTTFWSVDGRPVLSLVVATNPLRLTVSEWVDTYPGTPSAATTVTVAGIAALLFEEDGAGGANPTVYFDRGGKMFGLRGGVSLNGNPGVITRADFDVVLQGLGFAQ